MGRDDAKIAGEDACATRDITYSIVIPVYNSAESLPELRERLAKVFENTVEATYEIIMVDDASPNPETFPVLEALHRDAPHTRVFQLMHNTGQHNATLCGLQHARGEYIVMMDDDLQHPPEEIPKLIAAMHEPPGYDAVMGAPEQREHTSFRNVGSSFVNWMVNLAVPAKPRNLRLTSFRLVTRNLAEALLAYNGPGATIGTLICQYTPKMRNVTVVNHPRPHGESTYSVWKLTALALRNILNFSTLPLQLMTVAGCACFLFAVVYTCLLYTSPSPRDRTRSRMPSSA